MSEQNRNRLYVALLVLVTLLSTMTSVDRYAEAEYQDLFQRAFITFALARTLNGVISAVQGTELALQPAGVGVTLTPGEVLDPVNDLIERFSWIMMAATLSLGVQQVLLDVGQWWVIRLAVVAVMLGWLWLWARRRGKESSEPGHTEKILLRALIIVLFLRFAVPLTIIANQALYRVFLEPRYTESTQVIEAAGQDLEELHTTQQKTQEDDTEKGLFDLLGDTLDSTRETFDFGRKVDQIAARASDVIEHLIQLSVVFILQTGILPIAFLWIFLQILRNLFRFKN